MAIYVPIIMYCLRLFIVVLIVYFNVYSYYYLEPTDFKSVNLIGPYAGFIFRRSR